MNIARLSKSASIAVVRTACAVVFALFSFTYLFCYQGDVIAATQHVLSQGQTMYNTLAGALLITIGLLLLQWTVYMITRLRGLLHALTYFPSAFLLAIVATVTPDSQGNLTWSMPWWLMAVLLLFWLAATYVAAAIPAKKYKSPFLPMALASNVMLLCAQCLFVGLAGGGSDVMHYRMRMETLLMEGRTGDALNIGRKAQATDDNLTMLRAYALAKEGALGDKLFTYPVSGTSATLIPSVNSGGTHCVMLPQDSVYVLLGARPLAAQSTQQYLDALEKTGKATKATADYRLCALLIDRDLDNFARLLTRYYNVGDSLPKHYKEALILYNHSRSNPIVAYHDNVMDTDFDDMQTLERQYADKNARQLAVFKQYSGTYWWYYENQ